jgi:hypothetical protein
VRESRVIELELPGGAPLLVHAEQFGEPRGGGAADVGFRDTFRLDAVADAIKGVATAVHEALDSLRPEVVEVELGLDLALKGSRVLAMLVDAGSSASIKIRLEWHPSRTPREDETQ